MHTCTITRKRFFTFHNEVWGGPIFGGNGYGWGGAVNLVNVFLSESDLLRPKIDP